MHPQSKFARAMRGAEQAAPTAELFTHLREQTVVQRSVSVAPATASAAISLESYSPDMQSNVDDAVKSFSALAKSAYQATFGSDPKAQRASIAQEDAATISGLAASAPSAWLRQSRYAESSAKGFAGIDGTTLTHVINHADVMGAMDNRSPAFEAYDERNNKDVIAYSVAYNLQASRQNEFGEAFFPTVVVAPDQVGFNVQIRLLYAYNEVQRLATGALNDFGRRNLIRAIIDATILAVDQTRIIPVYRTGATDSSANFASGITPVTLTVDNQPLTTAPLAIGKSFSLLGISQTAANLAQGLEDQTDAVDSSVRLQKIYLKLTGTVASVATTEYIAIDVSSLPTSDFNAAPQGNTRKLQLNFSTKAIQLTGSMLTTAGATSALLAQALTTSTARLQVEISGSVVQDTGDTTTMAATPVTVSVTDEDGNALSLGSGAGATIATLLNGASVVGYDLLAYRTNSNRRNRGKLIDVQHVNYLYTVPLLPPISALRPVTANDAMDGNLLSDLVTTTRIQTSNAAVTALLQVRDTLAAYAGGADNVLTQPQIFGAAAQLVTPVYVRDSIDVATDIDSIKSQDRALDLQSLLINKIRDVATRAWVNSGYGPAAEAMYEGQPPKAVVIIGCDPILYRYLTLNGDTRLVGEQFDYKIVASYDSRMAGKLIFSFGQEASFTSGTPNPLHFGNMAWRPELTVMLPMVRGGAQSMELTVQPSYRHVPNLPIICELDVSNIELVIGGKVTINMHTI